MNKLLFPLSLAARAGGLSLDVEVPEELVRPKGVPESALRRVHVTGTLDEIDTEYIFRGTIEGTFEQPCDRCTEPASVTVAQDVTWLFEPASESGGAARRANEGDEEELDDERARYYDQEGIDLAPHVWEEMVLAAPSKFYCRADCKGLCPHCGRNLNEGACDCAPEIDEPGNSGLAALKDMFPNLPSKHSEE